MVVVKGIFRFIFC